MRRLLTQRIGGMLIALALVINFGLLTPLTAKAQLVVSNPDLVTIEIQKSVSEEIKRAIKEALVSSVASLLINLITQVTSNAARDAAIWVASGGNADEPLFEIRQPKDFLQDAAMSVIAELYNEIDWDKIEDGFLVSFNVYVSEDPEILQALRFGLRATVQSPIISSDYASAKDNWEAYLATLQSSDATSEEKTNDILSLVAQGFDPRVNEIAAGASIQYGAAIQAQNESQVLLEDLLNNHGYKPVVDFITHQIQTPADLVESQLNSATEQQQTITTQIALNALTNTDTLLQIGVNASSVFTNTLLNEFLKKIQSGLFSDITFNDDYDPFDEDSITSYSRSRIIQQYSSLSAFRPLEVSDYSLLAELSSCASSFRGSSRGLFSCAMDSSFATAVQSADAGEPLTISEAIEKGYIDGDWPLIPSSDEARNQDYKCYTYGFCHSNLVKLRRARIISVGWELAAESDANSETNPVTLNEVIAGFNNCNSSNQIDASHPWCHLIDPNWVLAFPETQCRTLAYGQLLVAASTDQRAQECVDIQSCITEDDNGNCTGGYGYCVREANVWRFRGDSCPEQYASCMSFVDYAGQPVDYLTNTLDYGDCSESNAGCLWYSTVKEETDGSFDWPSIPVVEIADEAADAYKERIYFNGQVDSCSESDAGCQQIIARSDTLRLNALANSGFELDSNGDDMPDTWIVSGLEYDNENDEGRTGDAAINTGSSGLAYQYITLQQNRFYTFSVYAKQDTSGGSATAAIFLGDEDGDDLDVSAVSYTDETCTRSSSSFQITLSPTDTQYERFTCTFTTPALTDGAAKIIAAVYFYGGDVWIDDVQLEQAEDSSSYHTSYNSTSLSYEYMKVAPSYLGCSGDEDDPSECDDYAPMCGEQDAGCTLYTPTNGDPAVSAVTSELDECPAICSGYDTFRQEATLYEPDGSFPVYFIPSSAQECSAEAVGCDEFTNLETEAIEYYTYLRACLTESQAEVNTGGDNSAIFYTWEGSDEEGYQLKTWVLLESDLDGSGYSPYSYADSTETDSAPGQAPCTNWVATQSGLECDDDSDGDGQYDTETSDCDQHSDIVENPDCREFYDTDGNIHYREWSSTITVNNECVSYRKTDIAGADSTAREENCTNSGGYFDSDNGFCRYYGYSEESTGCSDKESGCRMYTGGRSANSRVAFRDTFEKGTLSNWEAASATSVELSNESIATDGHSLKSSNNTVWTYLYEEECSSEDGCASGTGTLGGECLVTNGNTYCGTLEGELFTNKTYILSFWAKGETDISVGFDISASTTSPSVEVDFGNVEIETGWQQYTLGPLDMNAADYPKFGSGTVLVFSPDSSGTFYIDNVVLREGEDNITIIKDSWTTPATCDTNSEGAQDDQYHLGCQEYIDQDGNTAYLKSFSSLCDEDKVGCDAFYQTHQSQSSYINVYNATCYNTDNTTGSGTWTTPDTATTRTTCYLLTSTDGTSFNEDSSALCTIAAGDDNCQFDMENWYLPETVIEAGGDFANKSTYHIDYGPDATFVGADEDLYMVASADYECRSSAAGCTELGKPTFSDDQSAIASWESVYLLNSPDSYDDILCAHDELFCQEWESNSEGTWYYKSPGGHVCEYKTDVTVKTKTYDGWFQEGTNEFCYGTGYCADDEDVECAVDADCALAGAGTECVVDSGSYLIGGDYSGIWRNGDEDYTGWVGTCSSEYDGCTEWQDPLDYDEDEFYQSADGKSYFYIDNDNLDENSLLSSQKCDDQVSLELGCVLFNDVGDTGLDYNSSASYATSLHADVFYGDEVFALVDPIDCDDPGGGDFVIEGEDFDICQNRCVYKNIDLSTDYDSTVDDEYSYGAACYTDADCANYESDTGDLVEGSCAAVDEDWRLENDTNIVLKVNRDRECSEWLACSSSYTVWDEGANQYRTICDGIDLCTEYSAQGHPSFCSAWDSNDPAVVLDIDQYTDRDITWYGEEYSGYAVPNIFPIQHLTQVNTSAPLNTCDMSTFDEDSAIYSGYHGEYCESDDDCGPAVSQGNCITSGEDEDYRLGYAAGSCDGEYAESCIIGYCDNDGSACAADIDCLGGGDCVTGVCYALGETTCSSDKDCSAAQECLSGACVTRGDKCDAGDVELAYSCTTGETCVPSNATQVGDCFRGSCFLSLDGEPFSDEESEVPVCRANPEINSPFSTDIVKKWQYLQSGQDLNPSAASGDIVGVSLEQTEEELVLFEEDSDGTHYIVGNSSVSTDNDYGGALPYTTVTGYGRATVCGPGEDCECNYQKISNVSGVSAYIGPDTDADNVGGICSADSLVAGALCGDDDDCRYWDATLQAYSGTCTEITKIEKLIGLDGFCLERDTGISINGDPYTGACITWLPVDQLAGATDVYAKYKSAGYFEDTYYCSEIQTYGNLHSFRGCAGRHSLGTGSYGFDEDFASALSTFCPEYVKCPYGYFAVGSGALYGSEAQYCYYDTALVDPIWTRELGADATEQQVCPYMCVPEDSYHNDESSSEYGVGCGRPGDYDDTFISDYGGTETFWYDSHESYDATAEGYEDCIRFVTDMDEYTMSSYSEGLFDFNTEANYNDDEDGYYGCGSDGECYEYKTEDPIIGPVPVCESVVQVSSYDGGADGAAPWTDRIFNSDSQYELDAGLFTYTNNTELDPFGRADDINSESVLSYFFTNHFGGVAESDWLMPLIIPSCTDGDAYIPVDDAGDSPSCSDSSYPENFGTENGYIQAREFVNWELGGETSPNIVTADSVADALGRINNVFATVIDYFSWRMGTIGNHDPGEYGTYNSSYYDDYENADVRGTEGEPPTVWAIDLDHCGTKYCGEGEESALTLNNANSGEQEASSGFFRATLKFFAAANENQLPIRRVIVDWGDGDESGSYDDENYYKNHRGLQDDSESISKCDLCSDDKDLNGDTEPNCQWGYTADSCDPNYFSYSHTYRCSDNDIIRYDSCSDSDGDGILDESPCVDDGQCVYQPRVHVRDNWGFCAGTCTYDIAGEGDYCFDGDSAGLASSSFSSDECYYDWFPDNNSAVDPWVYYDGWVYVSP